MPSPSPNSPPPSDNPSYLYNRYRSNRQRLRSEEDGQNELGKQLGGGDGAIRKEKKGRKAAQTMTQTPSTSSRPPLPTSPQQPISPLISAINSTSNPFIPTNPHTHSPPGSVSPPSRYISPHRGIDAFAPVSTHVGSSPPLDTMRPRSIPRRQNSFGGRAYSNLTSPSPRRPSTIGRQTRGGSFTGNPLLPHEDQPHLHGALPDLESFIPDGAAPQMGIPPGQRGFFVGLDTLEGSGCIAGAIPKEVLVAGYEGGLSVSRICVNSRDNKGIEELGKLEGVRGSVLSAKILPVTTRQDAWKESRPLIAVVLHGPRAEDPEPENEADDPAVVVDSEDSQADASAKRRSEFPARARTGGDWLRFYETSVEVYSLSEQRHVSTLYTSQRMFAPADMDVPPPRPLTIHATGKFVTVTDGLSGEVFVFSSHFLTSNPTTDPTWRCIGKLWTTVLQRTFIETLGDQENAAYPVEDVQRVVHAPLLSLSTRWIALASPPSANSHITARGTALTSKATPNPPGLNLATPPAAPSISCNLDAQPVGFMSKVSREATQNLLKGAQWAYERGVRAYNTFWDETSPPHRPSSAGYGFPGDRQYASNFPPTHGLGNGPSNGEAKVVAIYDLEALLEGEDGKLRNVPEPLAAFASPSGISYLSFAPRGMNLLVVNRKGDDTSLWNLMNMTYLSAAGASPQNDKDDIIEPFVRHVWNTSRMSDARVVDVSWLGPRGERVAILTDKPTVHVHDIPSSALQRPPLRKRKAKGSIKQPQAVDNTNATSKDPKRWSSALESLNGAVKTVRDTSRSLSISGVPGFGSGLTASSTAATAKTGGRMVRQGITKGFGALTMQAQDVYHMQDNKLHLEQPPTGIAMPGLMSLITIPDTTGSIAKHTGRERSGLVVLEVGALRIYTVRQIVQHRKDAPSIYRIKISERYRKFQLPTIPDNRLPPSFIAAIEPHRGFNEYQEPGSQLTGYWNVRAPKAGVSGEIEAENWHAVMEAESNPPFQPFHFHRRYSHFYYSNPTLPIDMTSAQAQRRPLAADADTGTRRGVLPTHNEYDEASSQQDAYEGLKETSPNIEEDDVDPQKDVDCTSIDWDGLERDALAKQQHHVDDASQWLFGSPITGRKVQMPSLFGTSGAGEGGGHVGPGGEMENKIAIEGENGDGTGRIVITTMARRPKNEDEFFEDEAELVDFAD